MKTVYAFNLVVILLSLLSTSANANMGDWGSWGKRCETQTTCGACNSGEQVCTDVDCDGGISKRTVKCEMKVAQNDENGFETSQVSGYCHPKIKCDLSCEQGERVCSVQTCDGEHKSYVESCDETLLSKDLLQTKSANT